MKSLLIDFEKEFDKLWPNLYTVVPGLGQGDARFAVKRFIGDLLLRQHQKTLEMVKEKVFPAYEAEDDPDYERLSYNYALDRIIFMLDELKKGIQNED